MNLKIFTSNIEETALNQIEKLISVPAFSNAKIRIMPDVHAGSGCVIGFTADLGNKVIPNIVGVDIGCGMLVAELGQIDIDFDGFDQKIRQKVPSGFSVNQHENPLVKSFLEELYCVEELQNIPHLMRSLGTLGGGNHFIEIDEDEWGNKYLVIHTGSRNLGKQVADIYQKLAIQRAAENGLDIPKDLCYLEGEDREHYLNDMKVCQEFAHYNRGIILHSLVDNYYSTFEVIHNYISFEDNIVRKGAISAKKGERVLIPLNMRDGCILGVGKGNEDWNNSAPHGAGRILSRGAAKRTLSVEDFQETMKGIYSTSISEATLDEAPFAYKPSEEIIELVKDTVEIETIIKPIYNFKAS